jgi:hypothetical protein
MTMHVTTGRRRALPAAALALAVAASGALVTATASSAAAGTTTSQYGTISAGDGTLPAANRCGTYSYSYALTPPPGNWAIEFFVTDPRGNTVTSYVALNAYSAGGTTGSTSYSLCSNNTAPGVFTISAKMSTDDGYGKVQDFALAPATFTLSPAPRTTLTRAEIRAAKKAAKKASLKAAKKAAQRAKKKRANRD